MNLESPIKNPVSIPLATKLQEEAEELLQSGTWIWTIPAGTMQWSEGLYRLLGYSCKPTHEKLTLDNFLQHIPQAGHPNFTIELNRAVEERSVFTHTHLVNTAEGNIITVITKAKPQTDVSGQVTAMIGVVQNISEYANMQDEALQFKKLMDQYELTLQFGTWEYNALTRQFSWSVGMYNLFGYDAMRDKDMSVGLDLYEKHVDPSDLEKGDAIRDGIPADKNEYFWQFRITTLSGEVKWLESYGRIVRDKSGNVTRTVGITRNITRLKTYEHSLEAKIKELNRSNAELEEFAYVASHDLQEPLRKLSTFSERLTAKYSGVLQDDGQLYISRILAATANMRLLIENLLDFSRVARTPDPFENTDLNEILRKVLADLEVSIEEKNARITSERLPVIEAQAPLMKQLFSNILSNALKFRKPAVPPVIEISCKSLSQNEADRLNFSRGTTYFKIEVKDNGIGFEQEYAERIFQIFQRLHGKAEYPGSGIGLAICKKIADYHKGLISARGQLDVGATITIILPEKQ
ncbi:MAG TPA: PAS domain-containing protein [Chitinophagaceae bacterium]|nr:PAS domain-containing protein [Chitinophagaceae bacterium]